MTAYKTTFMLALAAFGTHLALSSILMPPAKTGVPVAVEDGTPPGQENKDPSYNAHRQDLHVEKPGKHTKLDLAFCIDTTSSMSGEIETVKAKVRSVVAKVSSGQPKPSVRVGLVAYRDKGDQYVTKVFPFSDNIDSVVRDISALRAEGGGDGPEAVDSGLHAALNELHWDGDKRTAKVLFLIGDAPPHLDRHDYDWKADAKVAADRHICINSIGCAGLEGYSNQERNVFKHVALSTNGIFQPLTYHEEIVDAAGQHHSLITLGGTTYKIKPTKGDWKKDADRLVDASMDKGADPFAGSAAPALQGATNGTIGPAGGDCTYITGVNTAGTVRDRGDNNLESVMLKGASDSINSLLK